MKTGWRALGRAVSRALDSPGFQALAMLGSYFGVMSPDPWWVWEREEPSIGGTLTEPPPHHPERLCSERPLTELELRLERELGISAGAPRWPDHRG